MQRKGAAEARNELPDLLAAAEKGRASQAAVRFRRSRRRRRELARRRNDRAMAILPSTGCSQSPPARRICGIEWVFSALVG